MKTKNRFVIALAVLTWVAVPALTSITHADGSKAGEAEQPAPSAVDKPKPDLDFHGLQFDIRDTAGGGKMGVVHGGGRIGVAGGREPGASFAGETVPGTVWVGIGVRFCKQNDAARPAGQPKNLPPGMVWSEN